MALRWEALPAQAMEGAGPFLRRLSRDRLARAGFLIVAVFALIAICGPWLAPQDPNAIDTQLRLQPPTLRHLLGTDNLGRDLFTRLLHGSRWSLGSVALASSLIMTLGVAVGLVTGFYGGWIDAVLMRIVDGILAFPSLLLAIVIAGALGPGISNVLVALCCVWWASYARVVRSLVLAVRARPWVEAARGIGASDLRIILRHILPNIFPPVLVLATLEMGELVLAIAGLNFLGLGVRPPTPEWGAMLNDGRPYLLTAPELMIYPGLAITALVVGFNLLGDGLRDLLDPRG